MAVWCFAEGALSIWKGLSEWGQTHRPPSISQNALQGHIVLSFQSNPAMNSKYNDVRVTLNELAGGRSNPGVKHWYSYEVLVSSIRSVSSNHGNGSCVKQSIICAGASVLSLGGVAVYLYILCWSLSSWGGAEATHWNSGLCCRLTARSPVQSETVHRPWAWV